ncbi:MAG: RNA-binding S4 domain-containing protein [Gammaproteobacteria bacterium]
MTTANTSEKVRLDKWLWAARFFKTRGQAKQAIEGGKVHCDGQRVKVAKEITTGVLLTIRQGFDKKDIKVIALSEQRRGAAEAAQLYEETPQSLAAREARAAERKAGRAGFTPSDRKPDKRERRQLERLKNKQN